MIEWKEKVTEGESMNEECLICGAALEYLQAPIPMECHICHKTEASTTRCVNGHYVCDSCHASGMDTIVSLCLNETSSDPVEIVEKMMSLPFCHMHGPEHHSMVGAALLTAYRNAGGDIDLEKLLPVMVQRGKQVPGGVCGFWGACGAGISTGIFISLITASSPLAGESWGLSNRMTANALNAIGEVGGPRCCKRDSYLAILSATRFVREHFGIEMGTHEVVCSRSRKNNQCIGLRCPFNPSRNRKTDHKEVCL